MQGVTGAADAESYRGCKELQEVHPARADDDLKFGGCCGDI